MIRQYGVEGMDHRNEQGNVSSRFPEESHKQRQDFDDSANPYTKRKPRLMMKPE
jgi:hypothetical protein